MTSTTSPLDTVPTRNWAGNIVFDASELREPESVEELQEIVAGTPRLKAVGSRHSFTRVADTLGMQLSVAKITSVIVIDEHNRTVTVSGGARYGEFVEQLDAAGWALQNLASLPHISVAGAIATGTHGSGNHNGSLSSAVSALELVTADGSILSVTRGDPDFAGMVVSLGALGIVTRVSLDIVPRFEVRQSVYESLSWNDAVANFDEITSLAYSVSLFTAWGNAGIDQVWLKSRVEGAGPSPLPPTLFGARASTRARHPLPELDGENTTAQLGVPGPWWDRLPHFTLGFTPSSGDEVQTEYLVPRAHALAAIEAVRALSPLISPLLLASELRTVAADTLWLSPSHGVDCVGFHFTWALPREGTARIDAVLPHLDATFAPFGARPHWAKVFDTDAPRLASLYPQLPAFRALAHRLDPEQKFRNPFLDRTVFTS